jgi:glycosyltransferase involved in cell wall biosynthesis
MTVGFDSSSRLKILFVTQSLSTGGAERLVSRLVNSLVDRMNVVVLIKSGEVSYKVKCPVYVASLGSGSSTFGRVRSIFAYAVNIRQIINKERPDVISASLVALPFSIFFALSSNSTRKRCVWNPSTNPFELIRSRTTIKMKFVTIYEAIVTVFIGAFGYVVSPSAYLLQRYRKLHLPLRHATTIRYFVDPNELHKFALQPPIVWPKDEVIVSVGRLATEKNHALLIRAFARVRGVARCKLFIVGDGPLRKDLLQLSESLNVSKDVSLLGFRDNPFNIMSRSRMFVLSSNFEGMPTSLLEAMALGVPVIATDCEGCIEILGIYTPAGIIVQKNNVVALAEAMLKLLQDRVLCENLSRMGKQRVSIFSVESALPRYTLLYQTIASKSDKW